MAGYDLELIKLLFMSKSSITLAGDPRQVTYHTHHSQKNKKYSKGKIMEYIKNKCKSIDYFIDSKTLNASRRNNKKICDFANSIFPNETPCTSLQNTQTKHDGIFLVKEKDVEKYLTQFSPTQLRWNKTTKINDSYEVKT